MPVRILPSILMVFVCAIIWSQEATEIYLLDLEEQDDQIVLSNAINISNNEGYDNQPSFTEDGNAVLFASFRAGQSDISKYFIQEKYRVWLTDTPESEFSPVQMPGSKKYYTCVRLNKDESQFLYKYAYKKKPPKVLIPDLKVGYYLWLDEKSLISFVISDIETLQVSNFKYKIRYPIQSNVGRSLSKIPFNAGLGNNLVSFISLEHEDPEIYSINPKTSESKYITDALSGSKDLAWTLKGSMIMGKGNQLYKYKPGIDKEWKPVKMDIDFSLKNISRITVSPDGSKLAVVCQE